MSNDLLATIQIIGTTGIAYWTFRTQVLTKATSQKTDAAIQHSAAAAQQSRANSEDIGTLKVEMDGHIQELLELTRKTSFAAGEQAGKRSTQRIEMPPHE